ncbi:Uncharacterised protein [Serratia plymuthica]|nr:Uncharacterised protein [Serratia plymuthica]VEI18735.1 Uncharacterised protein [Serratia plymuthica]
MPGKMIGAGLVILLTWRPLSALAPGAKVDTVTPAGSRGSDHKPERWLRLMSR